MQIKVFSFRFDEREKDVNEWLKKNKDKITILDKQVRTAASTGGHYTTIVFFYEEK